MRKQCHCKSPALVRGSILCGSCSRLIVEPLAADSIVNAADTSAKLVNDKTVVVSSSVLPDGGYKLLDPNLISSNVYASIVPYGDALLWALVGAGLEVAIEKAFKKFKNDQNNKKDIEDICLAVFAEYFGTAVKRSLKDLAQENRFAARIKEALEAHTKLSVPADTVALCALADELFRVAPKYNRTNLLLFGTLKLMQSKMMVSFGEVKIAYEALRALRGCRPCTRVLNQSLRGGADLLLLRQMLNHSYLSSINLGGRIDWYTYDYYSLIEEAANFLKIKFHQEMPLVNLKWEKHGPLGRGVGLHFGNAIFHQRLDRNDVSGARQALLERFNLAKDWDQKHPSQTTWNQFSQLAGQSLWIREESLATDVLVYAARRVGDLDWLSEKGGLTISPNPHVTRDPYNLEIILHHLLREQTSGVIRPDMQEGEGNLIDVKKRLNHLSRSMRFRRDAATMTCRIYPESLPEEKPNAYFPALGLGTSVFLPCIPRNFPVG